MRSLDEVLAELKAAEKEYAEKCLKYGIEEKQKKKKKAEVATDENDNPTGQTENGDVTLDNSDEKQDETN